MRDGNRLMVRGAEKFFILRSHSDADFHIHKEEAMKQLLQYRKTSPFLSDLTGYIRCGII